VPDTCPYTELAQSSSHPHIPPPEDPSQYYPPIYAWVSLVVSFPQFTVLPSSGARRRQIRGVWWVVFFLFPRLNRIMKGARFADVAAIREHGTAVLRSVPKRPLLTVSRSFMNVANSVLWRMAIILKANCLLICLYLQFCLFSGTIHRTFYTHHVGG
jgi:hypothetical protein